MAGMIKLSQSGYNLKIDGLFGGFLSRRTFVCFSITDFQIHFIL